MKNKKGMNELEESQFAIKEVKRFVSEMTNPNQVAADVSNYLIGYLKDNDYDDNASPVRVIQWTNAPNNFNEIMDLVIGKVKGASSLVWTEENDTSFLLDVETHQGHVLARLGDYVTAMNDDTLRVTKEHPIQTYRSKKVLDRNDKFQEIGCVDIGRDLWGNINCKLHIEPNTCGREVDCFMCENYNLKRSVISEANFEWALEQIKLGHKVKRDVVKNDTVIISYKNRLYQMSTDTGVRYPYVPTNADIHATDWSLVIDDTRKEASTTLGTIELIYEETDEINSTDTIAFIRGVIRKYKGDPIHNNDILDYIENQINT